MSAPSVPSNSSHVLNLAPASASTMRTTASPPRPASIKAATPPSSVTVQEKPGPSSVPTVEPKNRDEDRAFASPPPSKLPEVVVSPKSASASSSQNQAPAQLALMLSSALAEVDALKRQLSDEKKRAACAERIVQSFHPNLNLENGVSNEQRNGQLSEGAMKAVLDAEVRADRAERARDDALHALHSLSAHFAELERYESSLSIRASDARGAFTRLLTNITAAHPPQTSSPTLSGSPPALNLPALPPPLPAPSTNVSSSQYLTGPGAPPRPPSSSSSTRYTRSLPSHAPPSFNYVSHGPAHSRQTSHTHSSAFSSLPLPPPPSASGLGTNLIGGLSAAPPSSSSSFSVPAKRSHRSRSIRGLDDGTVESGTWDDPKRRRVGPWDMDVDEPQPGGHAEQPLPYYHHQPPLSAQSTQRIYERERERDRVQPQQSYARNAGTYPEVNGNGAPSVNGMVRVDARELVRDAKERERRENGLHYQRREGETRRRRRRRSASRSSVASSWSIDEMLLETATDGGRERREDGRPSPVGAPHDQAGPGHYPSHVYTQATSAPPPSSPQAQDEQTYVDHTSRKVGSHSSQPSTSSVTGVNGASGERGKSGKVPATQLVTLGPGGVVVSGGGQAAAPIPGGGFPAHNASGQRICRQCGVPGRYKDGKCVEKWGPGPEGPGTVCDRCRKKMKRVERRGTLDGTMAAAQQQALLAQPQSQSQSQLHAQPTLPLAPPQAPSHKRSRAPLRADTLLLDPHSQSQTQSTVRSASPRHTQQHAYSREREKMSDERSPEGSSRSHSPAPTYQPPSTPGSRYGQTYSQNQSQSQSQGHRRAPTPPYITSISTREQDDDGDADEDAEETLRDGNGDLDVDAEIVRAAEVENGSGSKSRDTSSRSATAYGLGSALNGTAHPPRSASRTSSTSTYERKGNARKLSSQTPANGKHMALPSMTTLPRAPRRRDTQDELDEDDADGDADGSGDADPDAEIMDAVDAAMKVEE